MDSDLNYYWTSENVGIGHCLNGADLDFTDSTADPDAEPDNVIGYNWAPHYFREPDSNKVQFWHNVPHDWRLPGNEFPTSMECEIQLDHGTEVAVVSQFTDSREYFVDSLWAVKKD